MYKSQLITYQQFQILKAYFISISDVTPTLSSETSGGNLSVVTSGNSGSSVPSLDRGEYAIICLIFSFLPSVVL